MSARTLPYIMWVQYKIESLRPTYRGRPASAKRRAQWRKYGQSGKGLARYSTYNASEKGQDRVAKYRNSIHGSTTLARARARNAIAAGKARLAALGVDPDAPLHSILADAILSAE